MELVSNLSCACTSEQGKCVNKMSQHGKADMRLRHIITVEGCHKYMSSCLEGQHMLALWASSPGKAT